jgi:predicted esterase
VPDWQSDDTVTGRANLLSSVSFAQLRAQELGGDAARISLCGWSRGANAAADVMLHPGVTEGWRPHSIVGLAGGYGESPILGTLLPDDMVTGGDVPCLLVHGARDEIVPVVRSREWHETLCGWGWQSTFREVDADHAGILGTRYDHAVRRCVPSEEPERLTAVGLVAQWVFEHIDTA